MKILILGGTKFIGRHSVDAALARGHEVTLFNRGKQNPGLFPEVETLRGDRDGGLDALRGRRWDAVLDTCGYVPRIVRQSAELLRGAVGHYTFVSSISAYQDFAVPDIDETYPGGTMPDESVEEVTGETYGPLKVLCERVVQEVYGERALVIRPGLVAGPHDHTGRVGYWPRRVAEGGDVLAPGDPNKRIQFIDARDLAGWMVRMMEAGGSGVFNSVCDDPTWTMGRLLAECRTLTGSDARFVWAESSWLLAQNVAPWSDLPLWLPDTGDLAHADSVSARKAAAHGLTFRPLAETIRDTMAWEATLPPEERTTAGITRERERELLEKLSENITAP